MGPIVRDVSEGGISPGEVDAILSGLRLSEIPVVLLRHRELTRREMFEGDYDFLIDERCRASFLRSLMTALVKQRHLFLLHNPTHPFAHKSTLRIYDTTERAFVTLEFWHELVVRGRRLRGALRWRDLEWGIEETEEGHSLRSEAGALLYLTHLSAKERGPDSTQVAERLGRYSSDLARSSGALAEEALRLVDLVATKQIELGTAAQRALALLCQQGGLRPRRPIARLQARRFLVDYPRSLGRRLSGTCVAVVGPDGSGKSTLAAALTDRSPAGSVRSQVFKKFFRDRLPYKVLMRIRAGRSREKRNVWDERVGAWLVILAFPAFLWAMARARRYTLVLDRYFYDFLMVGVRSPESAGNTRPTRHKILRIVPRPLLVLNPLAEHEDTTDRRDALSGVGFDSYQRQLMCFVARRPPEWFAHVPSSHGLEDCVEFALLASRRAKAIPSVTR